MTESSSVNEAKKCGNRIAVVNENVSEHARVDDTYEMLYQLGSGASGTVVLCRVARTGQLCALKLVSRQSLTSRRQRRNAWSERKALIDLHDHPFITKMYCSFTTRNYVVYCMEYCPGGDLYNALEHDAISSDMARLCAASIALALHHAHEHGIIYRDLKPENVLFYKDGFLRLADFGLARTSGGTGTNGSRKKAYASSFCGSLDYLAPEIVRCANYPNRYSMAVDWWSLGCVLFEMLNGRSPFYSADGKRAELYARIQKGNVVFPDTIGKDACDLISNLLKVDPRERLGNRVGGFEELKQHPYFASIDWEQLKSKTLSMPMELTPLKHELDVGRFSSVGREMRGKIEAMKYKSPSQSNRKIAGMLKVPLHKQLKEQVRRSSRYSEGNFDDFSEFDWQISSEVN